VYQGKRKVGIRHSIFPAYDILTFTLQILLTIFNLFCMITDGMREIKHCIKTIEKIFVVVFIIRRGLEGF